MGLPLKARVTINRAGASSAVNSHRGTAQPGVAADVRLPVPSNLKPPDSSAAPHFLPGRTPLNFIG